MAAAMAIQSLMKLLAERNMQLLLCGIEVNAASEHLTELFFRQKIQVSSIFCDEDENFW